MTRSLNGLGPEQEPDLSDMYPLWRALNIPDAFDICERILGITFPVEQRILVISYSGIHVVDLDGSWYVYDDERYPEGGDIYDSRNGRVIYDGKTYQVLGVRRDQVSLRNGYGEHIIFSHNRHRAPGQMTLTQSCQVRGKQGEVLLEYEFDDPSGDWMRPRFLLIPLFLPW